MQTDLKKPRSRNWKRILPGIVTGVVACILLAFGILAFALRGGGGRPATLLVTADVDRAFVQTIHDQQYKDAYAMLSEVLTPQFSFDQFVGEVHKDDRIFSTFQMLDVCDWGFFISNGRVIDSTSLIYYQDGAIVVQISLHKDSDKIWRVQGFVFKPNINPVPFGSCK